MEQLLQIIRALCTVIKNEMVENANTAVRVGGTLEQIVDALIDVKNQVDGAVETLAQQISQVGGYYNGYIIHLADFTPVLTRNSSSDAAVDRHPDYVFGTGAQNPDTVAPADNALCVRLTGADTITVERYESGAWAVKYTGAAHGGDLWSSLSSDLEYYYGLDKWNVNDAPVVIFDNVTLETDGGITKIKDGGISENKLDATLLTKINNAVTSPTIKQIQVYAAANEPTNKIADVMYCIIEN